MENDRHLFFWMALTDIIYLVICVVFVLFISSSEEPFIFRREYCLLMIPLILSLCAQSVIMYHEATKE